VSSKLYVGNLSFQVTEAELEELFGNYGTVTSVKIIMDRETNKSRGFCFVEMSSSDEAQKAIEGLNDKEAFGRNLRVNIAQEREKGGGGGGFGGGRGGDRGGYGGGGDRGGDRGGRGGDRGGYGGGGGRSRY
jgi:RNA recognition motif-containing protein